MDKKLYIKEYYTRNKEDIKKRKAEWYIKNKDKIIAQNSEYVKSHKERLNEIRKTYPSYKNNYSKGKRKYTYKDNARNLLRYRRKMGYIIPKPCEVCGEVKTQGHHEDYSKPYEVKWLCQKHHSEIHSKSSLI